MELYEIEGFLRGKRLPGDLLVGESNAQYIFRKFKERDALERELCMSEAKCKGYFSDAAVASLKCDALAVENAELKELIDQHAKGFAVCPQCSHEEPSETDDIVALYRSLETPATDAVIENIQAQGVEKLSEFAGKEYQRVVGDKTLQRKWKGIVLLCVDFASQLRKGASND